jgi:hypothetical protein
MVTILAAMLALAAFAGSAFAGLRSPQVPVLGGTLQGYLNTADGGINTATDQTDAQRWAATVSNNSTFTIQVELSGNASNNNLGLYNASAASPSLYQVFPGAASTGWFAVASYRTAPTRVIVNLFDASAALQGTTTYLGADSQQLRLLHLGPGRHVLHAGCAQPEQRGAGRDVRGHGHQRRLVVPLLRGDRPREQLGSGLRRCGPLPRVGQPDAGVEDLVGCAQVALPVIRSRS